MACWLIPLSDCCTGPLFVVKVGSGADVGWFPTITEGSTNDSCSGIAEFWALFLAVCNSASAGNGVSNVANSRGVMVSTGKEVLHLC